MKFRLNSPKFLTFLCYINLRLGKVCPHYKYDKKTINDWLKEYKFTFTRFVSNVTFNEKQQNKQNLVTGYTNQNFLTIQEFSSFFTMSERKRTVRYKNGIR